MTTNHDERRHSVVTIGIAGGSGAGKTTFAKAIYEELVLVAQEHVVIIHLVHDNYYKDISHLSLSQRALVNFDHPHSLDTDLLVSHLQAMKRGECVHVPNYDFTTHSRSPTSTQTVGGNGHCTSSIIILEGILLLTHEALLTELDIKIYVDADADVRLMRRIVRDTSQRGRTLTQVLDQYSTTVRPMHGMFVEPSKRNADLIVNSDVGKMNVALNIIVNHLKLTFGWHSHPSSNNYEKTATNTEKGNVTNRGEDDQPKEQL